MLRRWIHIGLFAALCAAWATAAAFAYPAADVLEARWVPDDCHVAPEHTGRVSVSWEALRYAGVPDGRLPFDAQHRWASADEVASVAAARADEDTYLAWPILMDRLVVVRMAFDHVGQPERVQALTTIHADRLIEMTAHRDGVVLWASGDHGVRRATLDPELSVIDFRLAASADDIGPAVRSTPLRFTRRPVILQEDANGFRSMLAASDPVLERGATRLPIGVERSSCIASGDQVVLVGPDLTPVSGPHAWGVRYGSVRLGALGMGGLAVVALLFALVVGERRQRRLEGPFHTGTVGHEGDERTWFDDEHGASALRTVERRLGSGGARAVMVGRVGAPDGYRGAAESRARVLFFGTASEWTAWLSRRRAGRERALWLAIAAATISAWGLLATVTF